MSLLLNEYGVILDQEHHMFDLDFPEHIGVRTRDKYVWKIPGF